MAYLSNAQARRVVLAAQGFADARPRGRIDIRHVRKVLKRLRALQIDSVNVLVRSHYLPLFSRLGPYRLGLLDELAYRRQEAFEYWGRMASYLPVEYIPLFRHRMEAISPGRRVQSVLAEHPGYIEAVLDEVRRRGPLTVSDLEDGGERTGPWWGHGRGKIALEYLFAKGVLGICERRNFTRVYDLFERTVPERYAAAPPLPPEEAHRELMVEAAAGLGVADEPSLRDFWWMRAEHTKRALAELVAEGRLEEVEVEGWQRPGYMVPGTRVPRRPSSAVALLTPFDPVVWHRERTERLFGFRYRIEIYVPEPQRHYGYYVLPFLMGDQLLARVDLKADRAGGRLLVKGAWAEEAADRSAVAEALFGELAELAVWLGLGDVALGRKGNLVGPLRAVAAAPAA